MYDCLVEYLDGHVLTDSVYCLIPVARYHKRNGGVKATVGGEVYGRTVKGIIGRSLHGICLKYGEAVRGLYAAQLGAGGKGSNHTVNGVSTDFNLLKKAALAQKVIISQSAASHVVARLSRSRNYVGTPRRGLIYTENGRKVNHAAKLLTHTRCYLCHDIYGRIGQHSFGDGDYNRQFLRVDVYVVPRLFGGLLKARVARYPVGHGQGIKYPYAGLIGSHVGHTAGKPQEGRILHGLLENLRYNLLLYKGFCRASVNYCHVFLFSFHK